MVAPFFMPDQALVEADRVVFVSGNQLAAWLGDQPDDLPFLARERIARHFTKPTRRLGRQERS
jgi:hypothetical protein